MQDKPVENEENKEVAKTSIIDMPLGGENPNPGFLTDQGAPYTTLDEEERKATDKKGKEEDKASQNP